MYNIQTAFIDIVKLYELLDSIDKRLRAVEDATMELLHKEQKPAKEKKQLKLKNNFILIKSRGKEHIWHTKIGMRTLATQAMTRYP